jgi:hypothetical protein
MKLEEVEVLELIEVSFSDPTVGQLIAIFEFWQDTDPTNEQLIDFLLELEKQIDDDEETHQE